MIRYSDLHKKLLDEGFEILAMFHNVEFASQNESHYSPPIKRIIEERHIAFRIIPAYLAYKDAPAEYKDRHIIYIPKGTSLKNNLLEGCETCQNFVD